MRRDGPSTASPCSAPRGLRARAEAPARAACCVGSFTAFETRAGGAPAGIPAVVRGLPGCCVCPVLSGNPDLLFAPSASLSRDFPPPHTCSSSASPASAGPGEPRPGTQGTGLKSVGPLSRDSSPACPRRSDSSLAPRGTRVIYLQGFAVQESTKRKGKWLANVKKPGSTPKKYRLKSSRDPSSPR